MDYAALLDPYFADLERNEQFSGVVLIARGTETLYARSYGYASRTWRIPNSLDMRFDCASVTKLFTAVGILQLIEQGHIALDTAVIPFLGIADTTISYAVKVQHILTHSSGIGDDADEESGESYEDVWIDKPNYSIRTTADFLPQFIHKPPYFAPGEGCRYNNVGFILLGLMIERCSGMTYREYIQKYVFTPAGMQDSGFFHMAQVTERVAEGCDPIEEAGQRIGWRRNIYSYPPIGSPDGGAHVTAPDLLRFLHAVQAGQLLSAAMTKAFLTPWVQNRTHEHGNEIVGYGLEFFVAPDGVVLYYHKDGYNAGVSANLRYFPPLNTSVILLSNMANGVWEPLRKITELLLSKE